MNRNIASVWYELDGVDFQLYEELAFLQGNREYCWPSREYLAVKLHVSIRTISRHTNKLRRLGLLNIQPRRYKRVNGTWWTRSNLYRVLTFLGAKIRQILALLTGRTRKSRIPERNEKKLLRGGIFSSRQGKTPPFLPPEDARLPSAPTLERIPLLKKWLERGNKP